MSLARIVLRTLAVGIAVLGAIDPVWTREGALRPPVTVAVQASIHGSADGGEAAARSAADAVQRALAGDYTVRQRWLAPGARGAACPDDTPCVLVGGDRWPAPVAAESARIVGAVRIADDGPAVRSTGIEIPSAAHRGAAGRLIVDLDARATPGGPSHVDVLDAGVPVGHAEHAWGDAAPAPVQVPIDWWPMGDGVRHLTVRVSDGRGGDVDTVDVGAAVRPEPYPVLVYDPRPAWSSTFLRRAIERDPRLAVRLMTRLGPRLAVSRGEPLQLDAATLDEVSVVVIGALDGLSAADVDLLERFVRVRGGSLVLAPDQLPAAPANRLLPAAAVTRLEPSPVRVGAWRASELLVFPQLPPGARPIASAGANPVVVAMPAGNGRVIVSGAMDAWRARDADDDAFDRAWQALVADAAAAGGDRLEVDVDRALVAPAEDVGVRVRLRAMAPPEAAVAVDATVACGDEAPRPLRLWPTSDRRVFEARFAPAAAGACRVAASSSAPLAARATADVVVAEGVRVLPASAQSSLVDLTAPFGARVVAAGDEAALAGDVRRLVGAQRGPRSLRPMRSPWWIVPFALCLGAEWWLRRRAGLR